MSSPPDLSLDFKDFAPTAEQVSGFPDVDISNQEQAGVQIRIPDNAGRTAPKPSTASFSTSKGLFQNLIQGATDASTPSGMSEESLRQLMWAASRLKQNQQQRSQHSGSFNWGLNYFAQFFDVDTDDVLERIIWSAVPVRKSGLDLENLDDSELLAPLAGDAHEQNQDHMKTISSVGQRPYSYMERFIQSRPDLYGPFWVSATLVFVIAIFSNVVSFLDHRSKLEMRIESHSGAIGNSNLTQQAGPSAGNFETTTDPDDWHYSMDELNIMSSVIMVYVTILPTFLWSLFWFRGCNKYYTLTETICAYGYSLSIFIPLALALTIQASFFRYLVVALTTTLSGAVLTLSFLPVAKSDPHPASSHLILAIVPVCHFALAYVIHRTMLV